MKSQIKVIKRMVEDYPNDFELGGKVRHYVRWLYERKQTNEKLPHQSFLFKPPSPFPGRQQKKRKNDNLN